ncbi:MAG: protein kinase [Actinobacteria bacterium]|nr:protein kinase [Actinomycetota bacterium]
MGVFVEDDRVETIDRYRLIKEIARGGQSRVCLCYDPKTEQRVALKIIEKKQLGDGEARRSFIREASALMKLDHPNIVRLYSFRSESNVGDNYLVMEYVEGRSLFERLRCDGALTPCEAVGITLDVCAALSTAHRERIIHKDVKPSNILLTGSGRAKLSDFGISSSAEESTGGGERIGTARYMAPELSNSTDNADARSDLYSLGVTLYEMLTGRAPFEEKDPITVSVKHLSEVPKPPHSLKPDVPRWLNDIVLKLLQKRPEKRYQSVDELAADLKIERAPSPDHLSPVTVDFPARRSGDRVTATLKGEGDHAVAITRAASAILLFFLATVLLIAATVSNLSGNQRLLKPILDGIKVEEPFAVELKQQLAVPSLLGSDLDSAERLLTASSFTYSVSYEWGTARVGSVIGQYPSPGAEATKGFRVKLRVSKGLPVVPNLIGKRLPEVQSMLTQTGLQLRDVKERESERQTGEVIEQSAIAGSTITPGSSVGITISTGRNNSTTPLEEKPSIGQRSSW